LLIRLNFFKISAKIAIEQATLLTASSVVLFSVLFKSKSQEAHTNQTTVVALRAMSTVHSSSSRFLSLPFANFLFPCSFCRNIPLVQNSGLVLLCVFYFCLIPMIVHNSHYSLLTWLPWEFSTDKMPH